MKYYTQLLDYLCKCTGFTQQGFANRGGERRAGFYENTPEVAPMSDRQFQLAPRQTQHWPKLKPSATLVEPL